MSVPLVSEWGARLRRLRESLGLSQTELAGRATTTQHTISRIERAEFNPNYELQSALADALGSTVTALFPRTDDEAGLVETAARCTNHGGGQ